MIPVPVYILAGGRSRRFGSDKARALLDGVPLITRVADMLRDVALDITVVADTPDKYADLDLPTIADPTPDLGPLAGLINALEHRLTRHGPGYLLLTACDVTTIRPPWIDQLCQHTLHQPPAVAFRDDKWQPMLGLYHTDLRPTARRNLQSGHSSMQQLLDDAPAAALPLPPDMPENWQINTPDDLADRRARPS